MAALCKQVFSGACVFSRNVAGEISHSTYLLQARTLFSKSSLGLENYLKTREAVHTQFSKMCDTFKSKMNEYIEPNSQNMIFTEDLKHIIHLVEPVPEDMDLVLKMMKKFNQQNQRLRFGSYIFGPVVMRMYYFLNKPEEALQAFKDPDLDGFFDQLMSYQVLMDLLYENNMYDEILEVCTIVKDKQIQNTKYPRNVVLLTLAACYKLNSPESLKYALDLWKDLREAGHNPVRKATAFAAGLALNQNSPHICLEMISGVKSQNYVTIRNLKAAALGDVGRPEDCLPILRSVLQVDDPASPKHTFTKEVFQKVKDAVEKLGDKNLSYDFQQLETLLVNQGHVETTLTLDDLLCTEIVQPINVPRNQDQRYLAASFNRQRQGSTYPERSYARPGLKQLY